MGLLGENIAGKSTLKINLCVCFRKKQNKQLAQKVYLMLNDD